MASFLQNVDLAAGISTALYSSASNVDTTANIRVINRNTTSATVSVAIVAAPDEATALATISPADYIEYDAAVSANDILENTGIVIPPSHVVVVKASSGNVNAVIYGFTQSV